MPLCPALTMCILILTRPNSRRETMHVGIIYVESDGSAFFTPDGIGRYHYDDLDSAIDDYAVTDSFTIEYM